MDNHKSQGYIVSETVHQAIMDLDRLLRDLEKEASTFCTFQASGPTGLHVRHYTFEAIGFLREGESALRAAQRNLEVNGYERIIDEMNKDG